MENLDKIKEGARVAVRDCTKVRPEENVVIITDNETRDIALIIKFEIEEITDTAVSGTWGVGNYL